MLQTYRHLHPVRHAKALCQLAQPGWKKCDNQTHQNRKHCGILRLVCYECS